MLFAQTRDGQDMDEIRTVLLDTIDALTERPPTEQEVQRAINALTRQFEQTLNDSGRIGIQLSEWAAAGDWRLMFLQRDRVAEVTVDDVVRVADHYLRRDNRTIGVFIPDRQPQRAEIPETPDVAALLADYQGREARSAGEAFEPSAANIEARAQRHVLSNGTRVVLLPKATRGERVFGQLTLRSGSEDTLMNLGAAPNMATSMLSRGSESLTRQQINDRIDELQSSLNIGGGWVVRAGMETQRTQLPELLDLAATLLRQPTFPERELAELKRQTINGIEQSQDDPGSVARQSLRQHLDPYPPGHPLHVADWQTQIAQIEAIERDDLVAFHASHYGFGPDATISLVGDFDAQSVLEQLEGLFGQWTTATDFERLTSQHVASSDDRLTAQMDDKANATLFAIQTIAMRADHPDHPALVLAGHMLGGGFLSSRLANRLRDQDGLSYAVGGGFSADDLDETGQFQFFAAFAPEAKDQLIDALFEELGRALNDGFGAEEVTTAQRGFLQQLEVRRSNDFSLAALLNQNLYLERDAFHQAAFEEAIAGLDAETINAALRRHMDLQQLMLSMAGDFESD
jgi:zinc protease